MTIQESIAVRQAERKCEALQAEVNRLRAILDDRATTDREDNEVFALLDCRKELPVPEIVLFHSGQVFDFDSAEINDAYETAAPDEAEDQEPIYMDAEVKETFGLSAVNDWLASHILSFVAGVIGICTWIAYACDAASLLTATIISIILYLFANIRF